MSYILYFKFNFYVIIVLHYKPTRYTIILQYIITIRKYCIKHTTCHNSHNSYSCKCVFANCKGVRLDYRYSFRIILLLDVYCCHTRYNRTCNVCIGIEGKLYCPDILIQCTNLLYVLHSYYHT